ncbi:hypothetical protein ACNOYE_01705 [Nannocystaceae bacterium ST9]
MTRSNPIMLGPDIRVLARGRGWLFAAWQDAYVLDWQTEVSRENLDASVEGARTLLASFPAGIATINVLHEAMPLPPADLREYAQRKMLDSPPGVRCHATALVERGVWASVMRAAMTGLYVFQSTPFPRRVFGETREAIAWSSSVLGHDEAWIRGVAEAVAQIAGECEPRLRSP